MKIPPEPPNVSSPCAPEADEIRRVRAWSVERITAADGESVVLRLLTGSEAAQAFVLRESDLLSIACSVLDSRPRADSLQTHVQ